MLAEYGVLAGKTELHSSMPSIIRLTEAPPLGGSPAPDVVVADHLEHRQKMGKAKKLPNRFPDVEELQSAAVRFCGNVQPNQCAQTRAVHVGQVRQVQQDSFAARNQLADLEVEAVVHSRHQPATASHLGAVIGLVNGNCQEARDSLVRHQNIPSGRVANGLKIAVARLYTLRPPMEQRKRSRPWLGFRAFRRESAALTVRRARKRHCFWPLEDRVVVLCNPMPTACSGCISAVAESIMPSPLQSHGGNECALAPGSCC